MSPSWATRSTGSWREVVLVPGMAVYPHQWVRPACGVGIGAGWVWGVLCPTAASVNWFISSSAPWEAVLVWFCAQPHFNQHCIKRKGAFEQWISAEATRANGSWPRLWWRKASKSLGWFSHFPDYVAESTFLLCPHQRFSHSVIPEGSPGKGLYEHDYVYVRGVNNGPFTAALSHPVLPHCSTALSGDGHPERLHFCLLCIPQAVAPHWSLWGCVSLLGDRWSLGTHNLSAASRRASLSDSEYVRSQLT